MAVQTITYGDKSYLNQNADIPATNKVQDTDMNEIKSVVNNNATILQGNTTYSLNETDTGKVWIDDKPIYRKVFDFGTLPNASNKYLNLDINNLDFVTSLYGVGYETTSGNFWSIPNVASSGIQYTVDLAIINKQQIRIRTGTDRTSYSAYIIIEYTKTS